MGAPVPPGTPAGLAWLRLPPGGGPPPRPPPVLPANSSPPPGPRIIVQGKTGTAVGTVARSIPQLEERRRPPADSPHRAVRLATRDDVVRRLKHEHREREAHHVAMMKIRERGLGM